MKRFVAISVIGVGIVVGVVCLFFFKQTTPKVSMPPIQPTASVAQTILSFEPASSVLAVNGSGTVAVSMDTKSNAVTAVQLEIQYDPTVVTNVTITPGDFLPKAIVLINRNEAKSGHITYALGISPAQQPVKGKGIIASLSFTTASRVKQGATKLQILPQSLVTSSGVDGSVLRSVSNAQIDIQ